VPDPIALLPRGDELSRALSGRPAREARALLEEIRGEAAAADPRSRAALSFADGAFALREGVLEVAERSFAEADAAFTATGDVESSERARIERAVALARRGKRELATEALEIATSLADGGATEAVRVAATIAIGTAQRVLGDAGAAQSTLAKAVLLSKDVPELKSQALNSLGTLCVVLGAYGAAEALLEHAAELARLRGDVIGEAIAMGQLGAAALGRGDPEAARRFLSRQEWLAASVGDAFGRTRALVWLAEVALDLERPDDAIEIAERARTSGQSVDPPLGTFIAYADRVAGRARLSMHDARGREALERARAAFASQRLPLGEALTARDLALASRPIDRAGLLAALADVAGLGTLDRVLEGLLRADADPTVTLEVASALPRRTEPLEASLVHDDPAVLASAARPRSAARKNLGRLAVLAFEGAPLVVAAIVAGEAREDGAALSEVIDSPRTRAAMIGQLGGVVVLAWSQTLPPARMAEDLAAAMTRLGPGARAAVRMRTDARVDGPGYGAALGARTRGVDVAALLASALAAPEGHASIASDTAASWAEAIALAGVAT